MEGVVDRGEQELLNWCRGRSFEAQPRLDFESFFYNQSPKATRSSLFHCRSAPINCRRRSPDTPSVKANCGNAEEGQYPKTNRYKALPHYTQLKNTMLFYERSYTPNMVE